jgi:hypothetical protein
MYCITIKGTVYDVSVAIKTIKMPGREEKIQAVRIVYMVNAGILSCHLDLRRFSSLLLGGNTREIRPSFRREVERVDF